MKPIKRMYCQDHNMIHVSGAADHVVCRVKVVPSNKTMEHWIFDGVAKATDGCTVEPDGSCPHGKQSWLMVVGLI